METNLKGDPMKYILAAVFSLSLFAGERILHIGDSHSAGPFGKKLDAKLLALRQAQQNCAAVANNRPLVDDALPQEPRLSQLVFPQPLEFQVRFQVRP